MPRSSELTFACPCGTEFTATIYQAVNITLEPELLYRLLAGSLNVATCPNCGRRAASAQPFVYHDMKRSLFAYVLPSADVSDEERDAILERLRQVYTFAVEESERITHRRERTAERPKPAVRRRRPYDDLRSKIEPDAPPMQVIFGVDRLVTLVESLLEPEEKLGKVALTARKADTPGRERMLRIVQQMAGQMGCFVEAEEEAGEYTVWLYGPRQRVAAMVRALNASA